MPKVAYSEEERQQIRDDLIRTALELMAEQGIQHTTVEQIYKKVGISRTFFYSFFPTKEDLVIEALYYQQPKIIAYVNQLIIKGYPFIKEEIEGTFQRMTQRMTEKERAEFKRLLSMAAEASIDQED